MWCVFLEWVGGGWALPHRPLPGAEQQRKYISSKVAEAKKWGAVNLREDAPTRTYTQGYDLPSATGAVLAPKHRMADAMRHSGL